tara:strand:- start:498 stop:770 length:273 start_codon:yes stop_codon:yes gene_type:complete
MKNSKKYNKKVYKYKKHSKNKKYSRKYKYSKKNKHLVKNKSKKVKKYKGGNPLTNNQFLWSIEDGLNNITNTLHGTDAPPNSNSVVQFVK